MKIEEVMNALYWGQPVNCSKDEYQNGIRTAIQEQAGKWIDNGQHIRAIIALEEVKRLDKKFA